MIPQPEFYGVGLEVVLLFQIRFIIFPDIMPQERNRNDEGDMPVLIVTDNLQQLLFFIWLQLFFEIPDGML
jgi:hypothetical protein